MEEPIISPDGKFVWTGSDWAPTDASEELNQESKQIYQTFSLKNFLIGNFPQSNFLISLLGELRGVSYSEAIIELREEVLFE